jgi:hypothetical protein
MFDETGTIPNKHRKRLQRQIKGLFGHGIPINIYKTRIGAAHVAFFMLIPDIGTPGKPLNGFKTSKKVVGRALGREFGRAFLTLQKRKVLNGRAFGRAFFVFFFAIGWYKKPYIYVKY